VRGWQSGSRRAGALLGALLWVVLGSAVAADLSASHTDATGRVQVDVHFDCRIAAPLARLRAAMAIHSTVKAGTLCVVDGWAQPADLPQLAAVPGVTRISAPSYVRRAPPRALQSVLHELVRAPARRQGSSASGIDGNGISIMRADQFVSQTGTRGTGVTVGVQSSGIYSLSAIQARGELPASVLVVHPAGSSGINYADEGTVLLEEVHAVAPGANLVYCDPATFVDYTSCMSQLINAGATILLDDTAFSSDGVMSQDNDQTSAVAQILAQNPNVLMLSSAGNNDGSYWEGTYAPVSAATTMLPALFCPGGTALPDAYVATFGSATSQTLTVEGSGANFPLILAWADPPGQITSQFDVFLISTGSNTILECFSSAGSTTNQFTQSVGLAGGTYTLVVASPDASAAGKFLKLWAGGDGLTMFSVATPGGLMSPQAMAPGVLNIGAVNGSDGVGNLIESFSSSGPLTFEFPAPTQLQAPSLVAPDGIMVDAAGTYFQQLLFPDGNFYGTSAAVPNAGAVAALLRADFPTLSVAQITSALQSGATVLGASAPDGIFGYGRVDAMGALAIVPRPTISALIDQSTTDSAATPGQPFTVTGTGTLHFAVGSTNSALVPGNLVAAGTTGVTISPGCGSSTQSCTLTVMPTVGQAGMATLTISVLDGANRGATAQMTLTSTNPAPAPAPTPTPTPTPAPTPSPAGGGGGAMPGWGLMFLSLLAAWSRRRRVVLQKHRELQHP
jgi:Subtilase family